MADILRMSFSLTATEEVSAGNSQTHTVVDSVAQRTWGGSISRIYNAGVDSDKICVWEGAVPDQQDGSAGDLTHGLDTSYWNKGDVPPTRGAIPDFAKVIAVEYLSSIGTANNFVYVYWGEEGSGSEKHGPSWNGIPGEVSWANTYDQSTASPLHTHLDWREEYADYLTRT